MAPGFAPNTLLDAGAGPGGAGWAALETLAISLVSTLLAAVGVYGVATIVFGLSRSLPLSLGAYLVAGRDTATLSRDELAALRRVAEGFEENA